jgi:hypothetical protein
MKKPSGKNISNNKDAKNSGNKILLENKPRKRRHSLKLKDFKVSSPAESKILSIICDNIFEDVNIDQNNNPSMIDPSTKINLKQFLEEENLNIINIEKESEKNIIISKTYNSKSKNNDNDLLEDDDFKKVQVHKKSYIFNNILKLKILKCPRLLEEQWKYEKILLDYNIIDFTSK